MNIVNHTTHSKISNRVKFPGGKRGLRKPTGKRNDSKEVVELGYLWNNASTDLVENLLKDGVAPNNVKS